MTVLSDLIAVAFLLTFLSIIVGAALREAPLAWCSRCGASFDSVPAFDDHTLCGDCGVRS